MSKKCINSPNPLIRWIEHNELMQTTICLAFAKQDTGFTLLRNAPS